MDFLRPEEVQKLCPVLSIDGVVGALYDPPDGHLDPAGTTHAYAAAARKQGAEIILRNRVGSLCELPEAWIYRHGGGVEGPGDLTGATPRTLVVDADDADVWAYETIWHDGTVVGFVTSGGYAHYVEKSVALEFVPVELIAEGNPFEIEILGNRLPAALVAEPLFDPAGERMRG